MLLANNCRKLIKSTKNIEENEDTEGNEQGRSDELRSESNEVLPSEESVSAGGIGETESNGGTKQQALKDLGPESERPTSYLDADYDAKQQAWEDWNIAYTEAVKTNYEANRQRDYSGLLELTESENVAGAEEIAQRIVLLQLFVYISLKAIQI